MPEYNPFAGFAQTLKEIGEGSLRRGLAYGQLAEAKREDLFRSELETAARSDDPLTNSAAIFRKHGKIQEAMLLQKEADEQARARQIKEITGGVPTTRSMEYFAGPYNPEFQSPIGLRQEQIPIREQFGLQSQALAGRGYLDEALKAAQAAKVFEPEKGEVPTIKEFTEGDKTVFRQWNKEAGKWDKLSEGRRFKPGEGGEKGEGFKTAKDLRGEYIAQSKDYRDVRDSYARIQEASKVPSAAGDVAIIFSYMRMLDPASTVREGEFATAANTGSIPSRVVAMYNKALTGERLADDMRTDFVTNANKLYKRQEAQHIGRKKEYIRLANKFGVDPETVIVDFSDPSMAADGKTKASSFWRQ